MFWEGLCLDRGVGPSNLGVHLEVNHRGSGIGGGGMLPSSMGRSASAMVKWGPKLLVPVLGPSGGPLSELMLQ